MSDRRHFPDTFDGVMKLTAFMRGPDGCPWDREQTHESLKAALIEECYELVEAIEAGDVAALAEELGDVSINLAFHLDIAREAGEFPSAQVFGGLIDKIVRRHPHVFGEAKVMDSTEVKKQWERIKQSERAGTEASSLDGVPRSMPALAYARSVQERAARVGFDWDDIGGVLDKVAEEVAEINEAGTPEEREAELGDLLFTIVNAGRWMGIDTEAALRSANARFYRRFGDMERTAADRGTSLSDLTMAEKESLWQTAKKSEA